MIIPGKKVMDRGKVLALFWLPIVFATLLGTDALALPDPESDPAISGESRARLSGRSPEEPVAGTLPDRVGKSPATVGTRTPADRDAPEPMSRIPVGESPATVGTRTPADRDAPEPMSRIPSVSQFRDVRATDWAFSSLQSLADRYGCIVGYPDGSFRGDRAMTRYEFATGLNACTRQIENLVRDGGTVTREDIETLKRLSREFQAELAAFGRRVADLESRTAFLEDRSFSTTTKLDGIVNFVVTGSSGEGANEIAFQERARLTLNTSFTGRDLLVTRMAAGNSTIPNLAGGTSEVAQAHQWYGDFNNDFFLVTLYYLFPVTEKLLAFATAAGGMHADYAYPPVNPYLEDFDGGRTTLSTFAQRNQIASLGGGTGIALVYQIDPSLTLGGGYYAGRGFSPTAGNGLFNGTYTAGANLKWRANDRLAFSVTYIHGYFSEGTFGFGDNSTSFGLPPYSGTAVVNQTLAKYPTSTNAYGAEFFWQVDPHFGIGSWVGFVAVNAAGAGDGEIWNYALSLVFPDLGREGGLGGVIIGAQPYLGSLEGVEKFANDTPWHLEAFYKYPLTDNISLTPGVIWHPAPNQDQDNPDIVTGTLRMTFTF